MKEISIEEAKLRGVEMVNTEMDNGEIRYRIVSDDGSSYARTVATEDSEWQNSHVHHQHQEMYVVQKGWVILAELIDHKLVQTRYKAGDYFLSKIDIPHNMYLSAGSVTHAVKFGVGEYSDWEAVPELDDLIFEEVEYRDLW
ncbi:MAG: hypothetical protein LBM27_01715 [Lactobacillaceae bacterium]|nr:hypothetical protein [Lactobacillaceae bacterium]